MFHFKVAYQPLLQYFFGVQPQSHNSRVSTVGPKAGVPGPVAFPLSLPGLDHTSSVLPRVFWPDENLGPKRASWG